jgi:hypothetical protein
MTGNFSDKSLEEVWVLLYAEVRENPLEGQCGQKQKRQRNKQRTAAQTEADQQKAQQQRGQDNVSSSVRSDAAKRAAETRKNCNNSPQQQVTTNQSRPL